MTIRLGRSLEGSLAGRARGRTIVVDAFRSRCRCSATWVGDITVKFADAHPAADFVEGEPLEGVPVLVRASLTRLLDVGGRAVW